MIDNKKQISSIQKGSEFEDKVFLVLSKLLTNNELCVVGENSRIYKKKGYYSNDRQKDIIVDISIETFRNQSVDQYYMLTVIECKNYKGKPVPVDDIEEFKSKLDQIAGKGCKGIMVSATRFAEGTLNYAKANGIALIRLLNIDEVVWDANRTTYTTAKTKENIERFNNAIHIGLLADTIDCHNPNYCFCKYHDKYYNSLSSLLFDMGVKNSGENIFIEYFVEKNFVNIPYIKKEEIVHAANEVLLAINQTTLETSIDMIIDYVVKEYDVMINETLGFGLDRNGNQILARYNPKKRIIEIDQRLDKHRKRFTLAHEVGHIVLHSTYLTSPVSEVSKIIPFEYNILDSNNVKRAEIQANIFAAELLMPHKIFFQKVIELAKCLSYTHRKDYFIYIDGQPCNFYNYDTLVRNLSTTFNVSIQAVEYRLKSFDGLVKDERKTPKTGGSHIDKFLEKLEMTLTHFQDI
jgi:Zn-dependent peptidase ImmA (M78 family)